MAAAVRVFTTVQEGGGASMLAGYAVGLALHVTLLTQILSYASGGAVQGGGKRSATLQRRAKLA